ncbi:MAG: hypothetical protein FJW31_21010 [Acidobacteria bacterium]|nr:hypothetical protein [Acidobacteriota bacterium]
MNRLLLRLLLTASLSQAASLETIRKEPNLEKRSELALANADLAIDRARTAYQNGEDAAFKTALDEVSASLDLGKQSLDATGKNARKKPKYFKKAEITIRRLARRLDTMRNEVSVDDRPAVEPVVTRAHALQEEILHAIMGTK